MYKQLDQRERTRMADIIPFPSKAVREWAILERTMTEILTGAGADAAASSHIMRRMKEFFALLDRDFSASIHYELPSSTTVAQQEKLRAALETMFASLATKWHDFTNELMVDRLKLEIQFYYAGRPESDPTGPPA